MADEPTKDKPYCGEDCAYVKRMEHDLGEMVKVIKRMEQSVGVAKSVIIGLTDENQRLQNEIRRQLVRRN
jgi:hypothetical protein